MVVSKETTNDPETKFQLLITTDEPGGLDPIRQTTVDGVRVNSSADLVTVLLTTEHGWTVKAWDYGGYIGTVRAEFTSVR